MNIKPRIKIKDIGGNLPEGLSISSLFKESGTLLVPDNTTPIHPASLKRFAEEVSSNREYYFLPTIPIASELGMPQYKPLMHWLPNTGNPFRSGWQKVKTFFSEGREILPHLNLFPDAIPVTNVSKEEQIYYFVDNFKTISPKPTQVSVVLGNICNLKCIMCPYHSPDIRKTHTTDFFAQKIWMSWELLDKISSECGQLKTAVKMGNIEEPLLHPQIIDFVRTCRRKGVPTVHITTNGTTLTEDKSAQLLDAGITSIYVSIDAAKEETYKQIRGKNLSEVENNLKTFIHLNKKMGHPCRVMTSFVKNKDVSEKETESFVNKWLDIADGVICYNLAEYRNGNSQFAKINDLVKDKISDAGSRWPCLNPWQEMYIMPDSRIYYCCETVSKLAFDKLQSMGDYKSQTITDIWNGPAFSSLRRDLILNQLNNWPACRDCGIWMSHVCQTTLEKGHKVTRNMITEIWE